jgi:hypothetical protein
MKISGIRAIDAEIIVEISRYVNYIKWVFAIQTLNGHLWLNVGEI